MVTLTSIFGVFTPIVNTAVTLLVLFDFVVGFFVIIRWLMMKLSTGHGYRWGLKPLELRTIDRLMSLREVTTEKGRSDYVSRADILDLIECGCVVARIGVDMLSHYRLTPFGHAFFFGMEHRHTIYRRDLPYRMMADMHQIDHNQFR